MVIGVGVGNTPVGVGVGVKITPVGVGVGLGSAPVGVGVGLGNTPVGVGVGLAMKPVGVTDGVMLGTRVQVCDVGLAMSRQCLGPVALGPSLSTQWPAASGVAGGASQL